MLRKPKCMYCGKKCSPKRDYITYPDMIAFHKECEKEQRIKELEKKMQEHIDGLYVIETQTINGYFVKTILFDVFIDKEVKLKLLAVFKDKESKEILQWNVDIYNLLGCLFTSDCYSAKNTFKQIAKAYYEKKEYIENMGR